ncbi:proteasome subunit alpha type-1 [Salpingoeca rosetta]|uniref:Proteasome subunit alpha type n=1 Tax=Salpingoeca rosetta (strain ATCC 50818 / BSB-021) TaxID=946362 RepID=F2U6J7_SALR5|nr:proteasome subunit alpha type-1 [Salpingoeca rosetta]EGD83479.1 proteasome subunit alpha type-1 [Salpingoeca rosetta]|eukprot:XP_004994983.1 proteasome subunit alpha type-1 [Salpingoeca rosetta]
MFRNQYDNDVVTWSPQGRIYQIEYAMEAVKQGSATVGVKNKTHAVLVAVKRKPSELSSHRRKVFDIDTHVCMSISGLTSDARSLARFLRSECTSSKWAFDEPLPVGRLVSALGEKLQRCTQFWSRRPFGVGLLLAGYDASGPHIYEVQPSANYFDCKSMAIGARSQSARTYLERQMTAIADSDRAGLIRHALLALRECLPSEAELTSENVTVAIVGKDEPCNILRDEAVQPYLDTLENDMDTDA